MKSLIRMMLVMILMLLVAGCSRPDSQLIGKWVGNTGSFEFFKDKTGVINPPQDRTDLPKNVKFKWEMPDTVSVKMFVDIRGGVTTIGKFEGKNVLIIENDKFVKAK